MASDADTTPVPETEFTLSHTTTLYIACRGVLALTGWCRDGAEAEEAADDHGAAGQPAPAPAVQDDGEERVGGELRGGRDRERDEHVQPQLPHVPDVAVEHQGHDHPAHARQRSRRVARAEASLERLRG